MIYRVYITGDAQPAIVLDTDLPARIINAIRLGAYGELTIKIRNKAGLGKGITAKMDSKELIAWIANIHDGGF